MPASTAAVLSTLRTNGGMTVREVAYELEVGESTARHHLDTLVASGQATRSRIARPGQSAALRFYAQES